MDSILDQLYEHFYAPPRREQERLHQQHRQLSALLNRPQRRMLLQLLDANGQMAERLARDSFRQGFLLAMKLFSQLNASEHEE